MCVCTAGCCLSQVTTYFASDTELTISEKNDFMDGSIGTSNTLQS